MTIIVNAKWLTLTSNSTEHQATIAMTMEQRQMIERKRKTTTKKLMRTLIQLHQGSLFILDSLAPTFLCTTIKLI